jgi:hypothetical protein
MRAVRELVDSVIGFNFNVQIVGPDGEPLKTGFKTVAPTEHAEKMSNRPVDPRFFTNFNHALLNKVRDFKSRNN